MTATPPDADSPLERAEVLVARLEEDAVRLARSALARVVEVAEDVWAEARSVRDQGHEER